MNLPLCVVCLLVAQPPGSLRFHDLDTDKGDVAVSLSPAQQKQVPSGKLTTQQGQEWLRLCVLDAQTKNPGPAMLGHYERDQSQLVFRPRFALEPEHTYRAYFGPAAAPLASADYRPASRHGGAPAAVVKIYPSGAVLPANVLKFYVYFSQPMRGGREIFNQIEIHDAAGNVISDAWLADELWDETGQVLIIYVHPGRIKWGVVLRDLLGPVLLPDRHYTLVVRGSMVDANGQKLGKDVTRKFHTTGEDRVRINLSDWKVSAPKSDTKEPVMVRFPKSIDHKSLERFLTIQDSKGAPVAGAIMIGKDEKSWSLTPARSWDNQGYRLLAAGRLEDVAGNTPLRPFDMDLQAPASPRQRLEIAFRPRP